MVLDKNEDILKWIKESRTELLKEIELIKGRINKMIIEEKTHPNLKEKNSYSEKISKENEKLKKLEIEEKKMEDLLIKVKGNNYSDTLNNRDKSLEEKMDREERRLRRSKNNNNRYNNRNRIPRRSSYY